jgi:hypothetical protein
MSELLDPAARLDPQRSRDLDATDAQMGVAVMRQYTVRIGTRDTTRLKVTISAVSSFAARDYAEEHYAGPLERIDVFPVTEEVIRG